MSNKKMIIKNCPAFLDDVQLLEFSAGTCNSLQNHRTNCQDFTDCLLKRIVKITKNYTKGCGKHCDINRKENNCGKTCNAYKIRQILELLDIQEVE